MVVKLIIGFRCQRCHRRKILPIKSKKKLCNFTCGRYQAIEVDTFRPRARPRKSGFYRGRGRRRIPHLETGCRTPQKMTSDS